MTQQLTQQQTARGVARGAWHRAAAQGSRSRGWDKHNGASARRDSAGPNGQATLTRAPAWTSLGDNRHCPQRQARRGLTQVPGSTAPGGQ